MTKTTGECDDTDGTTEQTAGNKQTSQKKHKTNGLPFIHVSCSNMLKEISVACLKY